MDALAESEEVFRGRIRAAPVWIWEVDIARVLPLVSNWEAPARLGGVFIRTLPLLETRVVVVSSSSSAITSTGLGIGGRLPIDRFSGRDDSSPRLFELLRPTRRFFSSLNT